jgi:mannose-1-phosphate guanylyltransferase
LRALLLAAGLGTRLRPLTNDTPKCMIKVNGRPLLSYWFDILNCDVINKILINLHYLPDQVIEFIEKSELKSKIETVQENKLLGTAGTILKNKNFFKDGPIMLIHADNLTFFDINEFFNLYVNRGKGIEILMMTFKTDDPSSCGIVELNENGIVEGFYEKTKKFHGNIANAAVYIISQSVVNFIQKLDKDVINFSEDVIPNFIGKIKTYHNDIYHRDIGTLKSLLKAENEIKNIEIIRQ